MNKPELRMVLSIVSAACSLLPALFFLLGGVIIVLVALSGKETGDPLTETVLLIGSLLAVACAIFGIIAAVKEKKDKSQRNRWFARITLLLAPVILWISMFIMTGFNFGAALTNREYGPFIYIGALLAVIACILPDKPNVNHSEPSENHIKE